MSKRNKLFRLKNLPLLQKRSWLKWRNLLLLLIRSFRGWLRIRPRGKLQGIGKLWEESRLIWRKCLWRRKIFLHNWRRRSLRMKDSLVLPRKNRRKRKKSQHQRKKKPLRRKSNPSLNKNQKQPNARATHQSNTKPSTAQQTEQQVV